MASEWSEWFEHDGRGQPVPDGTTVNGISRNGADRTWVAGTYILITRVGARGGLNLWEWAARDGVPEDVMRYRIKRPRALLDLIELVENLPEKVDA